MRAAMSNDSKQLPAPLWRAVGRFQQWRNKRRKGMPIPEPLWRLATQLAARFGVCQTASALKLDYYSLKKRLSENTSLEAVQPTAFLEVPSVPLPAAGECIIECENSAGARLRIHLKGTAMPDLAALGRGFWSAE